MDLRTAGMRQAGKNLRHALSRHSVTVGDISGANVLPMCWSGTQSTVVLVLSPPDLCLEESCGERHGRRWNPGGKHTPAYYSRATNLAIIFALSA